MNFKGNIFKPTIFKPILPTNLFIAGQSVIKTVDLDLVRLSQIESDLETKANLSDLETKANIIHNHVESDITDLDKYSQSQVDILLDDKANVLSWIDLIPEPILESGTISSSTTNTISDNTKQWLENEFVDKILRIWYNGISDYVLIFGNSNDTITSDCDFHFDPTIADGYEILSTYEIDVDNNLVAVDLRENSCAILLSKVTEDNERKWINPYIEKHANNNKCVVMTRCGDLILGQRWGTLDFFGEGVRLYAHTFLTTHWDFIQQFNIKRFGTFFFSDDIEITQTDFAVVCEGLTKEDSRRFVLYEEGNECYIVYTSLFPTTCMATINLHIEKVGGPAAEMEFTIRIIRDGNIIDFTDKIATTRFGSSVGRFTATLRIPIKIQYRDKLSLIAKKTGQTFFVESGSTFDIYEI